MARKQRNLRDPGRLSRPRGAGRRTGETGRGVLDDAGAILSAILDTLGRVRGEEVDALARAILDARRVYVAGSGRSGLVSSCFAMRLVHLGLVAHVVGEATAPGVGRGDLLVVASGSGRTRTVRAQATAAQSRGAHVAAVTADARSPLARAADLVVSIPCAPFAGATRRGPNAARGPSASAQPGGSLFEQSLLVFLDVMVLDLARRLGWSPERLKRTHSNLE